MLNLSLGLFLSLLDFIIFIILSLQPNFGLARWALPKQPVGHSVSYLLLEVAIRVVSTREYLTIWVNTNLTHLLNRSRFFNPNTIYLLNDLVVSTRL